MSAILLQQRITMTMDAHEAWALHNALGAMSERAWRTAGLNTDGIRAINKSQATPVARLDQEPK